MKCLKKLMCVATFVVTSLGFTSSANAALITQDILLDGSVYGSVTVNSNSGSDFGGIMQMMSFVSLVLDGKNVTDIFDFVAEVDPSNITAGLFSLSFDVGTADGFTYQGSFGLGNNRMDVFDANFSLVTFGPLTLSQPPTLVSEPAVAAMMLFAAFALGVRRSKAK